METADYQKLREFINDAGIVSTKEVRGQKDIVGFASNADQMQSIIDQAKVYAEDRVKILNEKEKLSHQTSFKAAICPHDDYAYAGRLYQLVAPHITAKRVILFGVFHFARFIDCENVIIFEDFDKWRTPQGHVPVSKLRNTIIDKMESVDTIINNDMHIVEQSIEALVHWIHAYNPDVEIIPILAPYMDWERTVELSDKLAEVIIEECEKNNWELGKDLALVISADAVHYGDVDWGGRKFDDFGCDTDGYKKAVERDIYLSKEYLSGMINEKKIKEFRSTCVDENNPLTHGVIWCGRYLIPFGLLTANKINETLNGKPLYGTFLDYGTSISEATLNLRGMEPLGFTAPNNLHHWVGYAAMGYL